MKTIYSSRKKINIAEVISLNTVRQALRDISSIKDLSESPLIELNAVYQQARPVNPYGSSIAKGRALKSILQTAVESIRPEEGLPDPNDKRWRPYLIVLEQYFQGRSPDWIQTQLSISKATYFFEQKKALEQIVHYLFCQEEDSCNSPSDEGRTFSSSSIFEIPLNLVPPLPNHYLIGREEIISTLIQKLLQIPRPAALSLYGLPGVGKTAIAIALANHTQIRDLFPDGILWASLGCSANLQGWLNKWAMSLGIPNEVIEQASDLRELAFLIHEAIGMRNMLIIIDDVWQLSSALALKVGGSNCDYLITTRLVPIAVSFSGEHAIRVHELPNEDGIQLLSTFVPHIALEYSDKLGDLVALAGGLPFALMVMGKHLQRESIHAQSRRIVQALSLLEQPQVRMQLSQPLSPLECTTDLPFETSPSLFNLIHLSEAMLESDAQRALLKLANFPPKPRTLTEEETLKILNTVPKVLDCLVDSSLIEHIAPDGYTVHRTIGEYAALRMEQIEKG